MNEIDLLEQQAVDAAMHQRWEEAAKLNEKILRLDSKNLPACLRLGFTYLQLKKNAEAKKYYQKALRIQPKNQVATENLERIQVLGDRGSKKSSNDGKSNIMNPNLFLEIPGKTKTVTLVNVGQKKDLAELTVGQEVELKLKKRKVEARTHGGSYVGSIPDDLSKRLISFLKAKSKYAAFIKEATLNKVILFIREVSKGKKVAHFSSFPANSQTNINQLTEESASQETDEEATVEGEDEWDVMTQELGQEEKEELVDIHHEEEEEVEE